MPGVQKVIRGRGSLKRLPEMMEKTGIRTPLIVGGKVLTAGMMRNVPEMLSFAVFSGYHANPDLDDAKEGLKLYQHFRCDGLISIGGGSCIDTAKAIKEQLIHDVGVVVPQIAIPGTAGTGSEATQTAVVYINGMKKSLSRQELLPDGVILDADLLDTLPVYHKKSSTLDALSQGIESYWSRSATDDSKVHAFLAILGVLDNLKGYLAGDSHAAEEMLDASFQSGKAINMTRTTAAHAMSYRLTKTLGIAHGHACMLTLPVLWEIMQESGKMNTLLDDLSSKIRMGDSRMVPKLLRGIMYDLDMVIPPVPDEETLQDLADSVNPERMSNHPLSMSSEEIKNVYRRAFAPPSNAERQVCLDIWRYYGR